MVCRWQKKSKKKESDKLCGDENVIYSTRSVRKNCFIQTIYILTCEHSASTLIKQQVDTESMQHFTTGIKLIGD